jgi:hypothetical protein
MQPWDQNVQGISSTYLRTGYKDYELGIGYLRISNVGMETLSLTLGVDLYYARYCTTCVRLKISMY